MAGELLIRMEIPVLPEMIFNKWLPLEESDYLTISTDTLNLQFWIIPESTGKKDLDTDRLANWANIPVEKILCDVTIGGLREELVDWILTRGPSGRLSPDEERISEEQSLQKDYEELAEQVYIVTLSCFNRLIQYVRVQQRQFWLQEHRLNTNVMASEFVRLRAKATLDGREWRPWYSTEKPQILTVGPMPMDRYLDEDSWNDASSFVNSDQRTRLTWELLAGAELLASTGYTRSALTEAITALEVAVTRFSMDPNANKAFGSELAGRMSLESLRSQIDHIGLSGTLRYLFPVIFSEEQVQTGLLKSCQEAIEQRQTVVHGGQREVQPEKLSSFLASIRELCAVLDELREG